MQARTRTGRNWPRIAALALSALVVVVLVGEWAGWPFLRSPLQRLMTSAAGVPVTLGGDFHLELIGTPRLHVGHLEVGAADSVSAAPHLADADGVDLSWHWGELWRWRQGGALRLESLRAQRLDAWLMRETDGRASWHIGGDAAIDAVPSIGVLTLGTAHIDVDDRLGDTRLRADVQGVAGNVDGEPPSGGYRVVANGRYTGMAFALKAEAGALLPLLSNAAAPTAPLSVDATVGRTRFSFDGNAAALLGGQRLDGDMRLRGPSMAAVGEVLGVTLPSTPPFELDGRLRVAGNVFQLSVASAMVGRSRLAGVFRYDRGATPPLLSGQLVGQRLAFADLGPAVGVPAGAAREIKSGRVLPQRDFDLPSLRAMNADVQVAIDKLDFGTPSLQPLHNVRTHVRLDDGVLRFDDLQAEVAGGTVAGSTQIDAKGEAAKWQASLGFNGINVATWVRGLQTGAAAPKARRSAVSDTNSAKAAARARDPQVAPPTGSAPLRAYLTGELEAQLDVTGTGRSTADILATLDGTAKARLRNGSLSHLVTELVGLDVAQALGVEVRGDEALPLKCARVDLRIDKGVAVPRVAVMDNSDSTLLATGSIDLRTERLDLRIVARPKDVSLLALRAPVLVGGTLADPVVTVEAGPLIARAAAAVALGVLATPVAAIIPFIDPGDPEHHDPCQGPLASAAPAAGASAASATR